MDTFGLGMGITKKVYRAWRDDMEASTPMVSLTTLSSTTNVTVRVTNASSEEVFFDTQQITVNARLDYRPPLLSASWTFESRSFLANLNNNLPTLGFYDIPTTAPAPPTAQPGSGPWTGEFVSEDPPYIPTSIYVVSDYSVGYGAAHAGANSTCASSSSNVLPSSTYHQVNGYCKHGHTRSYFEIRSETTRKSTRMASTIA